MKWVWGGRYVEGRIWVWGGNSLEKRCVGELDGFGGRDIGEGRSL